MSQNGPNDPIFFNSIYRHGVDPKRRLQIPSKWRPREGEIEFTLILWPRADQQEACLLVLPPDEWLALVQKLKAMPFADPKAETLRRLVGMKSDRVSLDTVGRICLPEGMARAAAIKTEAVLVGLVDRFEIWSPERFEITSESDEQHSAEAFQLI